VIAFIFIFCLLPETKGMNIEEINEILCPESKKNLKNLNQSLKIKKL
jgi:hypothetical protein